MENESLTVAEAASRLGVTEQTIQRWLRSGKLEGTMLGARAGWRIPSSSVAALLVQGDATGPEGEMLDRQYAYLTPREALYAIHIDRGGAVSVNLRWLADVVMALDDAGIKLAELSDRAPLFEYPRKAPRFVALREALQAVRLARKA